VTDYDPTDIQRQAAAAEDKARQEFVQREQEESDIRWLMGSKRGRRIVWRLLVQSGLFTSTFDPNAMTMAFAEGRRFFGGRVLETIHALCPELYPTMVKEQKKDV
jgi:hypothetical protein